MLSKVELQKLVGRRIVQLRSEKSWSQADLARACEKDRQSMDRIENGKVSPSLYSLYEIAVALGIQLDVLVKKVEE